MRFRIIASQLSIAERKDDAHCHLVWQGAALSHLTETDCRFPWGWLCHTLVHCIHVSFHGRQSVRAARRQLLFQMKFSHKQHSPQERGPVSTVSFRCDLLQRKIVHEAIGLELSFDYRCWRYVVRGANDKVFTEASQRAEKGWSSEHRQSHHWNSEQFVEHGPVARARVTWE